MLYLVGATVSLHGLWIYRVALGWYAWELSGSELWVGIVAATQFAPAVVFGPIFGVLADRFDRRAAAILLNALSFVNMLLLGLLVSLGFIDVRVLAVLALGQGIIDGAHTPVRMSIVPNLVERNQLTSAIALTSVAFNTSRFLGPALAGLVIAVFGVATAFVINGVSYLGMVVAVFMITLRPSGKPRDQRRHPVAELVEGARYVVRHETIRSLLVIAALGAVCGRGALEMLPVFSDDVYGGGATTLAMLTSAVGAGSVLTGLALSRGSTWLSVRFMHGALIATGALVVALGLLDGLAAGLALVALLGVTLSLCGIGAQILIQARVDDEIRGRVSSFWGMIAFGGTSLGSLLVGMGAHFFGLQAAVVSAGAVCASIALLQSLRRAT